MRGRRFVAASALLLAPAWAGPRDAPLPPGGAIEGRVLRAGFPVAGARVEVRRLFELDDNLNGLPYRALYERLLAGPDAWAPVAALTTDAEGRFAVAGLEPAVYGADVQRGGAFASTSVTVPLEGARVEARLAVPVGEVSLRGRVTTSDGTPFAGTLLWKTEAARNEHVGMALRGVRIPLDARGGFVAPVTASERVCLVAVEPGRRVVFGPLFDADPATAVEFLVDEGLLPQEIRVVDTATGAPTSDVSLLAKGFTAGGAFAMVAAKADAEGKATVGAPAGCEVWAYAPGRQEVAGERTDDHVLVRMTPLARVAGRVVRADDGSPVAGLAVHAAPARRRRSDWSHGHATTDADGRYAIESAQSGDVLVYATGPGWVTRDADRKSLREREDLVRTLVAGETTTVDLRVVPAATVRGRVLAPDGTPVTGAVVRAETSTSDPRGWASFGEDPATRAIAVTGADGRFAIEDLVPDEEVTLRARAVGSLEWTVDVKPVLAPAPDVDVRLDAGRPIDVLVLDGTTGKPVPRARLEVTVFPEGPSGLERWNGQAGEDGRARSDALLADARSLWVVASADGYASAKTRTGEGEPDESPFVLRLARPTTLAGRVEWPDGTPAAGVPVEFDCALDQPFDASGKTTTDESGAFAFGDVAPCDVVVKAEVHGRGGAEASVGARGGDAGVTLRLRPASRAEWNAGGPVLRVRVEDPDGRPVPWAWVTVRAPNDVVVEEPLEDGEAPIRGLPKDAPVVVEATDARDARGRPLPAASGRAEVAAGKDAVTVRLPAGASVSGRVVDERGEGVADVRIAATREGVDAPAFDPRTASGPDGSFVLRGLDPGRYVLVADPPVAWTGGEAAVVEAGAAGVVVPVRAAADVRIRVRGPKEEPVAGAVVRYRSSRSRARRVLSATTDGSGEATLSGVDAADEGRLEVVATEGLSVPLEPWRPKDETVRVGVVPSQARTDVVPHPESPLEPGHNVLWCATSQLAWEAMADAVARALPAAAKDGALRLLPPAPEALVERLNGRFLPRDAVDPRACVVVGGLAREGIAAKVASEWRRTFGPEATPPPLALGPLDVAGVAGLAKELPFEHPFRVHDRPVGFGGGPRILRAWGIRSYDRGPGAEQEARQLTTWIPPESPGHRSRRDRTATIVELRPADPDERIVLARLEPEATLLATWAAVAESMRTWKADTVDPGSLLIVPTVQLDVQERFTALEGAPLAGVPGSSLSSFHERVRFRLSERGASLRADSAAVMTLGIHPDLVFDGPFLVALRRADARVPYFLLWVGNDSLLERLVAPEGRPLAASELEPFVGRWAIDLDASRGAALLREAALAGPDEREALGFASGAQPTPTEILARELGFPEGAQPSLDEVLAKAREMHPWAPDEMRWDVRLTVRENASVLLEMDYGVVPEGTRPDRRSVGVLERFDGSPTLRLRDAEDDLTDESREPWREPLSLREDGRLEMSLAGGIWILRRR